MSKIVLSRNRKIGLNIQLNTKQREASLFITYTKLGFSKTSGMHFLPENVGFVRVDRPAIGWRTVTLKERLL